MSIHLANVMHASLLLLLLVFLGAVQAYEPCCEASMDPHRFEKPGIGFNLGFDYGTAAIYFPNETYVPVAKIEGSLQYKQRIRHIAEKSASREQCLHFYKPEEPGWEVGAKEFWHPFFPSLIPPLKEAVEFTNMIKALQAAVFAYTRERVQQVSLSISSPRPVMDDHILVHALRCAGIQPIWPRASVITTGLAAMIGDRVQEGYLPCSSLNRTLEYGLVLNVGRSAAMASLYRSDDLGMALAQEKISLELRYSVNSAHEDEESDVYWDRLRALIRSTLIFPDNKMPPRLKNGVDKVILVGEYASERRVQEILNEIVPQADTTSSYKTVDPVFLPALGTAAHARCIILHNGCSANRPELASSAPDEEL